MPDAFQRQELDVAENKIVQSGGNQPNTQDRYEITRADLPLHCPLPSMSLWNSHPKVYLPIEKTGKAICPYCSAEFVLAD